MPQAIFNPFPRNLFNYDEVKEAWSRYEQVAQALTKQCAPETLELAGINAYDHLNIFITLNFKKYAAAIDLIDTCEWILNRHITWLRPAIAETACLQRRARMHRAGQFIVALHQSFVSKRRLVEKSHLDFWQWAKQTRDGMGKLWYHEADISSAFEDIRVKMDGFNTWIEGFRRHCSRAATEDE